MTKEEAREFLMDKKVFVKNKGKEVQEKLFNIGFKWVAPEEKGIYKDRYFLFLYEDLTLTYVDVDDIEYFYEHRFKEISAENILSIKIERLPKTWEEFCKNNPIKDVEVIINMCGTLTYLIPGRKRRFNDKSALPNPLAAKAHLALMKLHQLRDSYREGFSKFPYAISRNGNHLYISNNEDKFLSFQTKEIADEFLFNFRDLIEQAGDLI